MLRDQLKVELKRWEHQFIDQNGRAPGKEDIKKLPEVRKMYKKYAILRKESSIKSKSVEENSSPVKSAMQSSMPANLELGPTPQIHGKAMSIFEMTISPTKTPPVEQPKEVEQSSPTSTIPEGETEHTVLMETSVRRQLTFDSTAGTLSPTKDSNNHYYGPNSPLKWNREDLKITIRHQSPLKRTPNKRLSATTSFSPSPLVKRPLTRSLMELMKEHEAFVEEFKNNDDAFVVSQEPDNIFTQDDDPIEAGDTKTVKTKRRRILRRQVDPAKDNPVKKDISQELEKLKRQRVNEFLGIDNAEPEPEPPTEDEEQETEEAQALKKSTKKRNKKYNLVSNNFRRLKLPRKSAANRRWNNRRR